MKFNSLPDYYRNLLIEKKISRNGNGLAICAACCRFDWLNLIAASSPLANCNCGGTMVLYHKMAAAAKGVYIAKTLTAENVLFFWLHRRIILREVCNEKSVIKANTIFRQSPSSIQCFPGIKTAVWAAACQRFYLMREEQLRQALARIKHQLVPPGVSTLWTTGRWCETN